MVLATKLDRSDQWTACEIVRWSEELSQSVGLQAKELAPAFAKLFATKDLRALYVERVHSLKAQASAASDAAKYLKETSKAFEEHVEDPDAPQLSPLVGKFLSSGKSLWQALAIDPQQ